MDWTCAVRECAHRNGGLVFICYEHVVQAFVAKGFEEVFSERSRSNVSVEEGS